jgi:hypothetical protein
MHSSSGAINFISDSHASRYNFETSQGMLRTIPERCPTKASARVTGLLVTVLYPRMETQKFHPVSAICKKEETAF